MNVGPIVTRQQVLVRASSWLRPSVPYSQTSCHTNEHGSYRTDCSGYVSMAWALPGRPANRHGGLNTAGLLTVGFEIAKDDLRPGDALIHAVGTRETRHVTLFARWADPVRAAYLAYEQAGPTGTVHRLIQYPYESGNRYLPLRYRQITD